jgi:alcohol dehydrogenase class IV
MTVDTLPERSILLDPIGIVRPEAIEFGPGSVAAVARFAAAKTLRRTLVVADAFNAARVDLLGLAGDVTVFGEVKFEPDIPSLEAALAAAERCEPDVVIGFGGGSAIDLAKLVAVLPGRGRRSTTSSGRGASTGAGSR